MSEPRANRWSSDHGTTLTEVLVVLGMSAIIVPSIYLAIVAGFRSERDQESAQVAEDELERVADRLATDIREFWPTDDRTSGAASELALGSMATNGDARGITWAIDGRSLLRIETVGSPASTVSKTEMLSDVALDEPAFRYWNDTGAEITDGRRLTNCAVRVTVALRTESDGNAAEVVFDVAHRTREPEAEPC